MSIRHAIWLVGDKPRALALARLSSEKELEDMIVETPSILDPSWMLVGRQEPTPYSGRIDLLAIAPDASLVLIELKRDRTPRDVVAQSLDYAGWVESLTSEKITQIYARFSKGGELGADFKKRFGVPLDEEALNQTHQIVLVASELDDSTERIIEYLNNRGIAINVLFFQVFELDSRLLMSRVWMVDPKVTQASATATPGRTRSAEPWNGEFYVNFGSGRPWEEARKFGYISAGGGKFYTQTLDLLSPGDRVWVNIPKKGYVGVGRVLGSPQSALEFTVRTDAGEVPCLDVLSDPEKLREEAGNPETEERFVSVEWIETIPEKGAFQEVGLFGNQNSVCRPRDPKWRHTVERLRTRFKVT